MVETPDRLLHGSRYVRGLLTEAREDKACVAWRAVLRAAGGSGVGSRRSVRWDAGALFCLALRGVPAVEGSLIRSTHDVSSVIRSMPRKAVASLRGTQNLYGTRNHS